MASKKVDRNSVVLGKNAARTSRLGSGQRAIWFASAGISLVAFAGCAADLENPDANFSAAYASASAGATGASGGSGGGGGGGMMVVVPPDPPCWEAIRDSCAGTCHNKTASPVLSSNLDLTGANLGARLVTTQANYSQITTGKEKCIPGALMFDPRTPANSVMLKKVSNLQECGGSMPLGSTLMGDNLKCIQDWANGFKVVAANVLTPDSSDGSDANNP